MLKRYPLKKLGDFRGYLIQCDYPEISKKIKHFLISYSKKDVVRGNHYHKRKREWFSILQGKTKLFLHDLKTGKKSSYIISSKKPELVEMEPFVAHTIKNIGSEELIFFEIIDEEFNPEDPDTYPFKIL
ncbi:hypothetical protein C4559_02095 [Candidatus Microgenomates bacterium]|nr:MAG: hypothetical protein C4559_02095 [Candidatus Microgenomates bacterium]